jgi:tagatose 6-phosphate kinase
MLVTVTLNPAFDHLLTLEEFHPGTLNRIPSTIRMPGGKGINVACSLATLGDEVIATGFLGGQGCLLFEKALRDIGVTTSFIYVNQEIRTDFFLIEEKLNRQSLVVEKGSPIELRYLNNFKDNFQRLLSFAELIEIGGSLPEGVPCIFLKELVSLANKKKVKVALNLPEPILLECSQGTKQYMVYPDLRETKRMFGLDIYDPQARLKIAKELLARGAEIVLLKFGNLNYLVATANEMWEGEIDLGEFRVMIGIRDAVLAGFIHKYLEDSDLAQALKYGLAAGRSTARNKKNYPNSKKEVEEFLPLAKVRKV